MIASGPARSFPARVFHRRQVPATHLRLQGYPIQIDNPARTRPGQSADVRKRHQRIAVYTQKNPVVFRFELLQR